MTTQRKRNQVRVLLIETGNRCCFCLCVLDEKSATREHITPAAHGGGNNRENLTVSCEDCNKMRGTEEFYAFEARRHKRPNYVAPPLKANVPRPWKQQRAGIVGRVMSALGRSVSR